MENRLANVLTRWREVIEAAETPFSKLAIFILPILAPLVPATLTGMHIYKLLLEIFTFSWSHQASTGLAIIVSVVLELLGYVGAIAFIQSVFRWIRYRKDEYLLPSALNGFSYVFYLLAMYLINVKLGEYFGTPVIMNSIVGLLSFITVPTSLLAANHLSQKEEKEETDTEKENNRQERIMKYKIKHGISPDAVAYPQQIDRVSEKKHQASDYKDYVFELFTQYGDLPLSEITEKVNKAKRVQLVHNDVKGTWFKYKTQWKRSQA